MASTSNLSVPNFECYLCHKPCHKYIEEINGQNQKVHYCSIKCFEEYVANKRHRRESREYSRTPHPKDLAKALDKIKKEEAEAKEKMFKGDGKN